MYMFIFVHILYRHLHVNIDGSDYDDSDTLFFLAFFFGLVYKLFRKSEITFIDIRFGLMDMWGNSK